MKVIKSEENLVEFDNGLRIIGDGVEDCCAYNFLDFEQLPVGTELPDKTIGEMVDYISLKDDGFSVKDVAGMPKWVQARSSQNGYYSNITTLMLQFGDKKISVKDLSGDIDY